MKIHELHGLRKNSMDPNDADLNDERRGRILDSRTGFYSRAFFHIRLKGEIARSERYRHFLSVILVHIESNPARDEVHGGVIQDFGKLAAMSLKRGTDIMAHYHERQMAIILPETDRVGAQIVLNRHEGLQLNFNGRLRFGIVSYPEDASNMQMFIHRLEEISEKIQGDKSKRPQTQFGFPPIEKIQGG